MNAPCPPLPSIPQPPGRRTGAASGAAFVSQRANRPLAASLASRREAGTRLGPETRPQVREIPRALGSRHVLHRPWEPGTGEDRASPSRHRGCRHRGCRHRGCRHRGCRAASASESHAHRTGCSAAPAAGCPGTSYRHDRYCKRRAEGNTRGSAIPHSVRLGWWPGPIAGSGQSRTSSDVLTGWLTLATQGRGVCRAQGGESSCKRSQRGRGVKSSAGLAQGGGAQTSAPHRAAASDPSCGRKPGL